MKQTPWRYWRQKADHEKYLAGQARMKGDFQKEFEHRNKAEEYDATADRLMYTPSLRREVGQ